MSNRPAVIEEGVRLAGWARGLRRSALQEMLAIVKRPGLLSFALGLPAPELFPAGLYAEAVSRVLSTEPHALQYSPSFRPLRAQVVELMKGRGVTCSEEQVFLTAGGQQGMNLLVRLLLEKGGQVLTEDLTYPGFQQAVASYEPEVLTVGSDARAGIDVEAVAWLLERGARPAAIYVITDGHNPLGVSMPAEKRRALVGLAREYRVPIIEDDAYGFLNYGQESLPPLRALDDRWVFYVGSFSKILAPALRVGWLVVPESLVPALSVVKEASDIDTCTLTQRAVSAFIDAGHLGPHVEALRREYRARRDLLARALKTYFPAGARWNVPQSGFFIWVDLPEAVDAARLVRQTVEEERVAFVPGSGFSVNDPSRAASSMRLNFSNCEPARVEEGIALIARVMERHLS